MDDLCRLKVSTADNFATLEMDSPNVYAFTRTLNDERTLALDRLTEMDDGRVVQLTNAGNLFRAGADLEDRAANIKGPDDKMADSRCTRETRARAFMRSAKAPGCRVPGPGTCQSDSPATAPPAICRANC